MIAGVSGNARTAAKNGAEWCGCQPLDPSVELVRRAAGPISPQIEQCICIALRIKSAEIHKHLFGAI